MTATPLAKYNILIRFIAIVMLGIYLLVPVLLFHHNMDMDMNHVMTSTDCPYMIGHNSMCPTNLMDHINTWKSMVTTLLPEFIIIFTLCLVVLHLYKQSKSKKIVKLFLYYRRKIYRNIFILFELLFSKGILNTKAY